MRYLRIVHHGDDKEPAAQRVPYFLVSPITFPEVFVCERRERVSRVERILDLVFPLSRRFDVSVSNKRTDAQFLELFLYLRDVVGVSRRVSNEEPKAV